MPEGLNVEGYGCIGELPIGCLAFISGMPNTYRLIDGANGAPVFNGIDSRFTHLPNGLYVNRGSQDVEAPNSWDTLPLQGVTPYDEYIRRGDSSFIFWISTTEVVGLLVSK